MFKCVVVVGVIMLFFFFKQKTAYEMRISDWSSDVCSSDLSAEAGQQGDLPGGARRDDGGARRPRFRARLRPYLPRGGRPCRATAAVAGGGRQGHGPADVYLALGRGRRVRAHLRRRPRSDRKSTRLKSSH